MERKRWWFSGGYANFTHQRSDGLKRWQQRIPMDGGSKRMQQQQPSDFGEQQL
jgi:hypothetical protein